MRKPPLHKKELLVYLYSMVFISFSEATSGLIFDVKKPAIVYL